MKISTNLRSRIRSLLSLILLILIPIIVFYLMESFTHDPFNTMQPGIHFLNIAFFELITALGVFLFRYAKIALWAVTILFGSIGLVNYFIIHFRSAPIMPWDILSFKTAASVADNYNYHLDQRSIIVLLSLFLVLTASCFCRIRIHSIKTRIFGILILLITLTGYVRYIQSSDCLSRFRLYDKLFTPTTMSYKDGTIVAFFMQLQYLSVDKPRGYSSDKAEQLLKQFTPSFDLAQEDVSTLMDPPNIIVIMNEAFSDPNILGDLVVNEDYIPFLHSLLSGAENTQSGYLGVSILGGNTANTEFEFLTGQSMAFLPQGSVPYQQYIQKDTFSLASWLTSMDYSAFALHPYGATGWQRHQVYPLLGFDRFLSLEDFQGAEEIRKYVSDESVYNKIIQLYEQKNTDHPLFLFTVTMQNHSSYTESFSDFTPHITVEGSDSFALSQYLSLLSVSDKEIQKLTEYFAAQKEKTLIVFFGDHQPTDSVVRDILKGKADDTDLARLRYRVPFFIWANYDIEEKQGLLSSPNYLGTLTLKAAKIPLSPFHTFLDKQQQIYPLISSIEVLDSSGKSHEITEVRQDLSDYSILQYYYLMEKGIHNEK